MCDSKSWGTLKRKYTNSTQSTTNSIKSCLGQNMGLWSKNSENKSNKICITLLRLILLLIYLPMYLSSNCIVLVFSLSLLILSFILLKSLSQLLLYLLPPLFIHGNLPVLNNMEHFSFIMADWLVKYSTISVTHFNKIPVKCIPKIQKEC